MIIDWLFLNCVLGLKQSFKVDELASKLHGAKEYISEKSEEGAFKQMKDQVGGMASKAGSAVSSIGKSSYIICLMFVAKYNLYFIID